MKNKKGYPEYPAIEEKLNSESWLGNFNDLTTDEKLIWLSAQDAWDEVVYDRIEELFGEPWMEPSDDLGWGEMREGYAEFQKRDPDFWPDGSPYNLDTTAANFETLFFVQGLSELDDSELSKSGKTALADLIDSFVFCCEDSGAEKAKSDPRAYLDSFVEDYRQRLAHMEERENADFFS